MDYDLEDRLIEFSANVIEFVGDFPESQEGRHLSNQIMRSGTAPASNYAEAMSPESQKDFIHKMKISLKELRETHVWLRICRRIDIAGRETDLEQIINECDELISIFVKSIETAEDNLDS